MPDLERSFVRFSVGVGVVAWTALLAAELGLFRLDFLAAAAPLVLAVALLARRRLAASSAAARTPEGDERPHAEPAPAGRPLWSIALALLLLLAAVRFLPPYETVLWASDATVYLNHARQIERHHGLVYEDPLIADVPAEVRAELFANREPGGVTGGYTRFPGGLVIPRIDEPRVTASFAPLFPVTGALFQALFGLRGGLFVAPLFALLGVAAVFLVACRLADPGAGLLAAALLALSLPQTWFARFGMPAVLAQFFVFAGLLALLVARDEDSPGTGAAAGFLFGLAVFTKFDLLFVLLLAASGFASLALLSRGRADREASAAGTGASSPGGRGSVTAAFCSAFALMLVHNVVHYLVVPSNYGAFLARVLGAATAAVGIDVAVDAWAALWALLLLTVIAAGGSLVWLLRGVSPRVARGCAIAALVLIAGYVAFYFLGSDNRVLETLAWLGGHLSWPVLALFGLALAAWLLRPRPGSGRELLLVLLAAAAVHHVYDPHEPTRHLWSIRRFVPVVIPAMLIVVSVSVAGAGERIRLRGRRWATIGVAALLAVMIAAPGRLLAGQTPWRGAVEQVREIAASLPPNAVVLVGDDLAGTHLATSLSYLQGIDAIVVRRGYSRPSILQELSLHLLESRREVFLALAGDLHFAAPRLALVGRRELDVDLPLPETSESRLPDTIVQVTRPVELFRVVERPEDPRAFVDVGERADDTLYELTGFHAAERDEAVFDGTFRWTGAVASIVVPGAESFDLLLDAARPDGAAGAEVSIWVGGEPVALDVELDGAARVLTVPNPAPDAASFTDVMISSTVFVPADAGVAEDGRRLGVRLYGVRLRPPVCCDE